MKHRVRAGLIHLALSAAIAAAVFLPIYFFWYPDVLFEKAGGRHLFLLIAGVDLVIGPLVTFVIFVPKKKGLMFDLAVIAILQTAALAYGVYVLFESRPVYIVFVKDRYQLTRANDIARGELEKAGAKGFDELPVGGPKIVGARMPKEPDEQQRLMIAAIAGMDLNVFPQHYVPYDEVRAEARAAALPLETLRKRNAARPGAVSAVLARLGRRDEEVRFLPMHAGAAHLAVFIDANSGDILKITALNPWGD
jgi:hypothetical protein